MTKRSHGEGSIQPRGAAWRIRYRVNGRRFERTIQGSRADAAKALREALKAGDDGKHVAPDKLTLREWIADWLGLKARTLKPRSHERYGEILSDHVLPVLGGHALQRITGRDIDRLYAKFTLAPRTAQFLHAVLKACLNSAVKKKLIPTNPVADAERPRAIGDANETILDEDQLGALVRGFEGHSLYPIVAVAAFTGMRRNEILALRWQDIDLDAGTISVTRNVEDTKAHGRRVGTPKSKARSFQIEPSLAALLRQEREQHLRLVAGVGNAAVDLALVKLPKDALAFPALGTLTELRCPAGVTTGFLRRARKLGFHIRFHGLRASHETALLDRGVPVHVVAKRCGHDPAMLLRVYARRTSKADTAAANLGLMEGVLGANLGPRSPNVPGR